MAKVEASRMVIRWARVIRPTCSTSAVMSSSEPKRNARAEWQTRLSLRHLRLDHMLCPQAAACRGTAPCRAPIRQRNRGVLRAIPSPPRQSPTHRAGRLAKAIEQSVFTPVLSWSRAGDMPLRHKQIGDEYLSLPVPRTPRTCQMSSSRRLIWGTARCG